MFLEDKTTGKRFQINAELGKGTYGKCYLLTDTDTGLKIACKEIKFLNEFQPEANLHSKLSHKNIVKFIDSFISERTGYIIMELCTKGNLDGLLQARKFLNNAEAKCIIKQVATGLDYLHSKLIVHRDIKLLNLLISETMDIKIADFGFAQQFQSRNDTRESFCGTNNYVAPEIIDGIGYSFSVDIWALGCVLYTLLVGKEPFAGSTIVTTLENISKISYKSSNLTTSASRFLAKIFVIDPEKRPTSSSILNDKYFSTGAIIDALPTTIFSKPSEELTISKTLKRQPLVDRTNTLASKNDMFIAGKENNVPNVKFNMVLRPRGQKPAFDYKSLIAKEKENLVLPKKKGLGYKEKLCDAETLKFRNKQDPVRNASVRPDISQKQMKSSDCVQYDLERQLLNATEKMLQLESIKHCSQVRSSQSSFLCVSRWAEMGSGILAYTLSDGSLGINIRDFQGHLLRYPGGKMKYFQEDKAISFMKGNIPMGLERLVEWSDEARSLLLDLKKTGPTVFFKNPVVLPIWKYYRDGHSKSTVTTFLLTNGSCQVNLPNHEKFIINMKEDLIATWIGAEATILSVQKCLQYGLPHELSEKLQIVRHFLKEVIPISKPLGR